MRESVKPKPVELADEYRREYMQLQHAMQAGVKFDQLSGDVETPKSVRVGINTALVQQAALSRLLVAKGVITDEEYWRSLRDLMREEVQRYEALLSARFNKKVTLGTPFVDPVRGE